MCLVDWAAKLKGQLTVFSEEGAIMMNVSCKKFWVSEGVFLSIVSALLYL